VVTLDPKFAPSRRNWTAAIPALSAAEADIVTTPLTVAPFDGDVIETEGFGPFPGLLLELAEPAHPKLNNARPRTQVNKRVLGDPIWKSFLPVTESLMMFLKHFPQALARNHQGSKSGTLPRATNLGESGRTL
jgi:hypothetical protein